MKYFILHFLPFEDSKCIFQAFKYRYFHYI